MFICHLIAKVASYLEIVTPTNSIYNAAQHSVVLNRALQW